MNSSVLDEEVFVRCCQLFLQHSDSLGDGWVWEQVEGSAEGYMKKTMMRTVFMQSSPEGDQETDRLTEVHPQGPDEEQRRFSASVTSDAALDTRDDDDDNDDGVCVVAEHGSTVLQYEYHVLYSCSYSTPVLYFRVFTMDGRSLSLEEVWRSVHPSYRLRLQHSPLNTITQQEHPFLGQSFFFLHPCRTEEFMRPVMQAALEEHRQVNYVVTWLSIVGPMVGLDIPLNYSMQSPPHNGPPGTKPD